MRTGGASWLMPFIVLSYHCTVLLTTAFYFLPYTMRVTVTIAYTSMPGVKPRVSVLPHYARLEQPGSSGNLDARIRRRTVTQRVLLVELVQL